MSNLELEVFRAGDYGAKGKWDGEALEQIAADYKPALHEAPVTLDHAQSGPAHGWVAGVRRAGDKLIATLRGLSAHLLELLKTGSFKKRSVEIYPQLRETGRPYLRAVSFLGAAVPEIKGLGDAEPAGGGTVADEIVSENGAVIQAETAATRLFQENESAWTAFDDEDVGQAFQLAGDTQVGKPAPPANPAPPVPFSEVAENLRRAGRWQPAWVERGIEQFYDALTQLPALDFSPLAFSDVQRSVAAAVDVPSSSSVSSVASCLNLSPSPISPAVWFSEFLAALPPAVIFDPVAAPVTSPSASFAVPIQFTETTPGGPPVASHSIQLHRAALALQQSNPQLSYSDALLLAAR